MKEWNESAAIKRTEDAVKLASNIGLMDEHKSKDGIIQWECEELKVWIDDVVSQSEQQSVAMTTDASSN